VRLSSKLIINCCSDSPSLQSSSRLVLDGNLTSVADNSILNGRCSDTIVVTICKSVCDAKSDYLAFKTIDLI
jgi:hypothetical protein